MLQRVASLFVVAAVLVLANGCRCTQPSICGDACGIADCGSSGCAAEPRQAGGLAGCSNKMLTCGSGCGEVYWGPWINDPPSRGDPCDNYGNWTGDACCAPICNPLGGLRHLWGYRYASSCGDVACDTWAEPAMEWLPTEEVIEQEFEPPPVPEPEPAPAKQASRKSPVRHATYWRPTGR